MATKKARMKPKKSHTKAKAKRKTASRASKAAPLVYPKPFSKAW